MKNFSIIQVVVIGISIIAIVAGVLMFSLFTGRGGSSRVGNIVLWGTLSQETFGNILIELQDNNPSLEGLEYIEKNPNTMEGELLKAVAEGEGPDLVLLNEKQIISNQKRMQVIPFKSFPLRDYQNLFFDESELLVTKEGILGFPFLVDPLIMYYNKDSLANAGFSRVPETWTEVLALAPALTQKDSSFNISKSAIALGSFDNITNSKDIYTTLVLQAGNPVIVRDSESQENVELYKSVFKDNLTYTLNPAYAATNFFTQFSNPTKTIYSWNKSLQTSQTMFTAGDLAFYLGYASELPLIKKLNPNLNFDIALIPQSQTSNRKVTYGSMYIFTIPRTSSNTIGAMKVIASLTSKSIQSDYAKAFGIAPTRKDLLATSEASNPYESVFNRSAIIAKGVLDPSASGMRDIIKELIDTIVSGQYEISEAIARADAKIIKLIQNE